MHGGTALVKYDAARRALAEAHSIDEVKAIRDKAEAMRAYARQAGDLEMQIWVAEIKLRAERRAGELLREMAERGERDQGKGGDRKSQSQGAIVKLVDFGIDPSESARWQLESDLPEEDFDAWLAKHKERKSVPTSSGLRAEVTRRKNAELKAASPPPPAGEYETIVIDPPWPMAKIERDVRPNQVEFDYPTMDEEELAAYKLPTAPDCHLFVWTTQRFLPMAFRLLDPWGFKYVCTFVWHKPGGFQPVKLPQYNCEFALYARKGSPSFVTTKDLPTCFNAGRREHSRKPVEFYEIVKRVTAGPRIEIFAREKRDGFEQAGNETDKFE